jgi:hypothetical protein
VDESAVQPPVYHPLGCLQRGLGTVRYNRGDKRYITLHCKQKSINVFLEKELRGLSPNFHIHVSVNDFSIPSMFSCSRKGRPIVRIYKSLTDRMWKLGLRPCNSFSGNICFEFLVLCLCSSNVKPTFFKDCLLSFSH